jgi:asparagine synthase (glutamine-hydrolysing)
MPTFSIRFDGGPYFDETRYARIVAQHVGAQITCATPAAADLSKLFAALIWHMDMPMPNTGGFAYFTVSELAAKYVKVTLTGHGGDEVFAGYPAQFLTAFGSLEMFEFVSLADASPGMTWPNEKTDYGRLSRKVRSFLLNRRLHITPAERQWLRLHCDAMPGFNPALHPNFVSRLGGYSPVPEYLESFRNAETDVLLDRCLHHDLRCYLPGLLHMEDRVSMALSLESRVPLLDYRIVEYMATVPVEQKVRGREPKYLLRRIASRILPPDIAQRRDKSPFPVPAQAWFTGELGDMVRSILHAPVSLDRGIFNPDYLRAGRLTPNALWTALNVEMWFRIFVDRDPVWMAASQNLNGNGDLSVDEVLVGGTSTRHKPTPVGLVSLDPDEPLDPPVFP